MKSTVLIFLLTIPFTATTASAATATCDRLENAWYSRYVKDFNIRWDTESFRCPGTEGNLAQTFMDLESAQFVPADSYRPNFYRYIRASFKKTTHDPKCAYMATGGDGVLTLCPPFFKYPRENRAAVLIHEGRHMDDVDPSHVTCARGRFRGDTMACDEKFYDGEWQGSGFNAEVFFVNWIMKGSNQNDLSRSVSQSLINALVPDRFNEINPRVLSKWRDQ